MYGTHLARRKQARGKHRAEGFFAFRLRLVRLVTLAGKRAVELEANPTWLGGLFDGDCYWLTHAPRR
jgi:hypothetical protein